MKRVLFDENMPRELRSDLPDLEVRTVQEVGWAGVVNGELLRLAEVQFDVLITADRRLQHQQNIAALSIAVVVVAARSTRLADLRPLARDITLAATEALPGTVTVVPATSPRTLLSG